MASYSVFMQRIRIKADCAHECELVALNKCLTKATKKEFYKKLYAERDQLLSEAKEPKRNRAAQRKAVAWLSVGLAMSTITNKE